MNTPTETTPVESIAPSPPVPTPNLDYLRDQVNKLKLLLDDPQPGLASWVIMYGDRMKAINDFWNDKPRKEDA